jgi:hypothetical protein
MSDAGDQPLLRPVHAGGAEKLFGELTVEDVRARADELSAAVGWGPTARVAGVAHAWKDLVRVMEQESAGTVSDLGTEKAGALVERLWVVPPGGSLLR